MVGKPLIPSEVVRAPVAVAFTKSLLFIEFLMFCITFLFKRFGVMISE
jgi:hypothetical protein